MRAITPTPAGLRHLRSTTQVGVMGKARVGGPSECGRFGAPHSAYSEPCPLVLRPLVPLVPAARKAPPVARKVPMGRGNKGDFAPTHCWARCAERARSTAGHRTQRTGLSGHTRHAPGRAGGAFRMHRHASRFGPTPCLSTTGLGAERHQAHSRRAPHGRTRAVPRRFYVLPLESLDDQATTHTHKMERC